MAKYPGQSPYVAFNNNPMFFTDPYGDDPPEGFEKWRGANGTDLYVPQSTKELGVFVDEDCNGKINYGTKALQASAGEVRRFSIGGNTFRARFKANGDFNGYWDAKGNKYKTPDITVSAGGFSGTDRYIMNTTFDVKNVPAGGLQMVQPVEYSGLTPAAQTSAMRYGMTFNADGLITGQYYFNDGGVNYAGEVDGATGSYFSYQNGGNAANPAGPYYNSVAELANPRYANLSWNRTSGSITAYDAVSARVEQKEIKFTTMIVATDYMGTGRDIVLGTYRWGWDNYGTTPLHSASPSLKGNTPTKRELDIINKYYPAYSLFK